MARSMACTVCFWGPGSRGGAGALRRTRARLTTPSGLDLGAHALAVVPAILAVSPPEARAVYQENAPTGLAVLVKALKADKRLTAYGAMPLGVVVAELLAALRVEDPRGSNTPTTHSRIPHSRGVRHFRELQRALRHV